MGIFRTSIGSILLILFFITTGSAACADELQLVGETAVLMDAKTGQVLYEKKAHQRMYPASTTKMLTAIVALEMGSLDEIVTVSENASLTEGSAIWVQEGEQLPLEDLVYALMLNSANDAGVAIAEHLAGSEENFAKILNKRAAELGARNTHFTNAHGLPDKEHYTTAYDLAVIARHALNNPTFAKIAATKTKVIDRTEYVEPTMELINHNRLLWLYEGAIGVKTGYTNEAQQCIVAAAEKDGRRLIAVVLKSQGINIWADARKLLDYGFDNFYLQKILSKGDPVGKINPKYSEEEVSLLAAEDVYYNFPKEHQPDIRHKIHLDGEPTAPFAKGTELGKLAIYDGSQLISTAKLVSGSAVERPLKTYFWFKAMRAVALLAGIFIMVKFLKSRKHKRRTNYYIRRIR